jgi:uncharacterized circularly permuted ATP-grasp superfamily protein/uncharacterized alpha-E superfamily protein
MTPNATESPTALNAAQTHAKPAGLAGSYSPRAGTLDEMLGADGSLRAHWRPFVSMMDDLGRGEILSRSDQARRIIRENGITHNVYGETGGLARPWSLDLLPLLIPDAEWRTVSEALIQRARLLNAIIGDLYGPATAVSTGILPPELVYESLWFLRPVHGVKPPHDLWIHLYAADLVRAPDGSFQVLSDRTQAPSGAGYCLENRIVLSRVLPTIFRQCHVLRLAPFFISLRKMLASIAPSNRENPRVVLMTPGPYNETYFEHAYLARYLGYTLVQGNDLTVRDCRVFLKTLSGLQRVDVILRRVDDDFCDPLELYSNSYLGIPGLCQAVRERTVTVANALGSGLVQAPAFLPYLPALCRHFLAEDLRIPSVQTWWAGDPNSLKYILEHLPKLIIKNAFPAKKSDPIFGDELSDDQLSMLASKIQASPNTFIAQDRATTSAAPVLANDQLQSRQLVLRAFLSASDDSYTVMPGGLTRVSASPTSLIVSLQSGGGSKDTWMLGGGPQTEVSLLTATSQPLELDRSAGDLTSRVADNLFWLGRYTQRAEGIVRLARSTFARLLDPNSLEGYRTLSLLLRQLIGWSPKLDTTVARTVVAEVFAPRDPSGLFSSIDHVHSLARILRDRISVDAWQILREIEREAPKFARSQPSLISPDDDRIPDFLELLNKLVQGFLAFSGMAADSMTRGHGWRFLDLGMRIERAVAVAHLLRATLVNVTEEEIAMLDALLDITDSSLTYRRRYFTRIEAPAVLDLLIADEINPRAIAYQVAAMEQHLSNLPRESNHPRRAPDHQLAIKLRTTLRLADISAICQPTNSYRERLGTLLSETLDTLTKISELVSQTYFSHASTSDLVLGDAKEQ